MTYFAGIFRATMIPHYSENTVYIVVVEWKFVCVPEMITLKDLYRAMLGAMSEVRRANWSGIDVMYVG